ncbi:MULTISPECIES: AraC family transcriptional regulator [Roseobacteraceae]|nr:MULTISPECIES: AraC family transcriptional regulator [Roseobacteraceae]
MAGLFHTSSTIDTLANAWDSPMFGKAKKFRFISDRTKLTEESIALPKSGFRLTRLFSTGHEIEISVHDTGALLLPLNGRVGIRVAGSEVWANSGKSALLSRPCDRWSVVDPLNDEFCQCLVFQFSKDLYSDRDSEGLISGELLEILPYGMELRFSDAHNYRLVRYLQLLSDELSPGSPVVPTERYLEGMEILLEECVKDAIFHLTISDYSQVASSRDVERAKLVEAFIREKFHEPLRVAEIARDIGMGVRSLQTAFRKTYGITIRQMIADTRIEYAHRRLCDPHPQDQVSTIAYECGITHLGRFSQAYARKFDEHPNETISRARNTSIS